MSIAESPTRSAAEPCPRCTKPLTDPSGLGWCPACGYCRSLEETAGKAPSAKKESVEPPAVMPLEPPKPASEFVVPFWVFPLVLGTGAIIALSIFLPGRLTPSPLARALWTSLQVGGGILLLLVGQFVALMRFAAEDEKLGFKDAILPFRLYGLVFSKLPKGQLSVWTLGWGLSAIVCAFVFIGGLGHWFTYLNKDKNKNPPPITGRP